MLASRVALALPSLVQSFGPLADPPALLVGLAILFAILLVGRVLMAIAWRLVILAIGVVIGLWVVGMLGFQFGIL